MTLLFVIGVMLFAVGAFVIRSGYFENGPRSKITPNISIGEEIMCWLVILGTSCIIAAIWQALS